MPLILRGSWFTWEDGLPTQTIIDANSMSNRGYCIDIKHHGADYSFVLKGKADCFHCMKTFPRTLNIFEKFEGPCVSIPNGVEPTVENICKGLNEDQQLITLFNENFVPINCRSSLEGVWHFTYQNRFRFTGVCNKPDARIQSCRTPGSQFLITNQKFNISYQQCEGVDGTFTGTVEYSWLGDWFVGKNHYFAVANTKESRKDGKYRCFLKNRDDDLYIGVSVTAQCNKLKTPENSRGRLKLSPVKAEVVVPACTLLQNFSGEWVNTANIDADVTISETHINGTYYPDKSRYRRTIYVYHQKNGNRYMMARLTVDGCQKDYVCFDFMPKHHNVIRYRKGLAVIKDDFSTVCSWVQFPNKEAWKYDLFLAKNPVPVRCPVTGKFNFTQRGEHPFKTRILGGVTLSPRPDIRCKQNISDLSVCDTDQKEMGIDEDWDITRNGAYRAVRLVNFYFVIVFLVVFIGTRIFSILNK